MEYIIMELIYIDHRGPGSLWVTCGAVIYICIIRIDARIDPYTHSPAAAAGNKHTHTPSRPVVECT